MHIGHSNYKAKYEMNGKFLEEVTEERDLCVIMQSDLKCSSLSFVQKHFFLVCRIGTVESAAQ